MFLPFRVEDDTLSHVIQLIRACNLDDLLQHTKQTKKEQRGNEKNPDYSESKGKIQLIMIEQVY